MLPTVNDVAGLETLRGKRELWQRPVSDLVRSLGFPDAPLVDLGGGNLVVGVGNDHVLKLGPLAFERELRGEQSALRSSRTNSWFRSVVSFSFSRPPWRVDELKAFRDRSAANARPRCETVQSLAIDQIASFGGVGLPCAQK